MEDMAWCAALESQWRIGEAGARRALEDFIGSGLEQYRSKRDYPDFPATSRLSPHLHFGEISPHYVWQRIGESGYSEHAAAFKRQLVWREFSYSLLYHEPRLPEHNLKEKFNRFPWYSIDGVGNSSPRAIRIPAGSNTSSDSTNASVKILPPAGRSAGLITAR